MQHCSSDGPAYTVSFILSAIGDLWGPTNCVLCNTAVAKGRKNPILTDLSNAVLCKLLNFKNCKDPLLLL